MKQKDGMVVALLGVIAGLLIVFIFQLQGAPQAAGQTSASTSGNWMMATSVSQNSAVCFLFKADTDRLGVYTVIGENQFTLVGTRTVTQEFGVREYGRSVRPTYKEIEKAIKDVGGAGGGKK